MDELKAWCGKTKSTSGKPFTEESLKQHLESCKKCHNHHVRELEDAGLDADIYDLIGDDVPDGAFWAMYNEMGGTF